MSENKYILAFDTANESICVALGKLDGNKITYHAGSEDKAHRASNQMLLPEVEKLMKKTKVKREQLAGVCVGRGPGSFTGVRIALATAKGIATALKIPIVGINTLEAVAWRAWTAGIRGHVFVVADAMRHEIYPLLCESTEEGIKVLSPNKVLKAEKCAEEAFEISGKVDNLTVVGDALHKYFVLFEGLNIGNEELWVPSPESLILNYDKKNETHPSTILPVYTRLSDAEESEREKLADVAKKNLNVGVQNLNETSFQPMDANDIKEIVTLEKDLMGSDAWNDKKFIAELKQTNRSWWVTKEKGKIIGYAGAMQADNKMELLKIGVAKQYQKQGIATKLISYLANDMRDLSAQELILEVRKANSSAQSFYKKLGLKQITQREKYYSDGEDALVFNGPLPIIKKDVGGMNLHSDANSKDKAKSQKPIIFAVESSCDETACAITANGEVISDVVASQIDFHKRFGGVVPEIASRKHIEAIVGVADECIDQSGYKWKDLDAVAVTYAPGLVGALVVGMAFAKGLAFALDKPLIIVNHLEGHLYANKLTCEGIKLPAIASIISGGNTLLVHVKDWGKYKTLGTTIDDAAGEAFDKLAKYLGLGYPGGPVISKLAKDGNPNAIKFPRAMIHEDNFDFSLSGLKTAVINYVEEHKEGKDFNLNDLCASFEQAIIDVQVDKARRAIHKTKAESFLFGGGVAANPALRSAYEKMCKEEGVEMVMAPLSACGDNAAMISLVADKRYKQKKFAKLDSDVEAHASIDVEY